MILYHAKCSVSLVILSILVAFFPFVLLNSGYNILHGGGEATADLHVDPFSFFGGDGEEIK